MKVTFLSKKPVIDGILDSDLQDLPVMKFKKKSKSKWKNPDFRVSYRLGYGLNFFYVYVEVETDSIICRDRGYQHGDGFHMVLALPKPGRKRTDEFYILDFWPQQSDGSQRIIGRKMIDLYNMNLSFKELKDAEFDVKAIDGKVGFELLLPWHEVYPYHPWFSDTLGFNLCFVKAIEKQDMNNYYLLAGWTIRVENWRKPYLLLNFEKPSRYDENQNYAVIDRNCFEGNAIKAKFAVKSQDLKISIKALDPKDREISDENLIASETSGLSYKEIYLNTSKSPPGNYQFNWESTSSDSKGSIEFTILPKFDYKLLSSKLEGLKDKITQGSLTTLKFKLDDLNKSLLKLKPYELVKELGENITEICEIIDKAQSGKDIISEKRGIFRRAFRSKIDDTLQPYSVKIPVDYDQKKKYPLFVYLHGSSSDDRNLLSFEKVITIKDFILLAPFARGLSNCYAPKNARKDILEAIDDVIKNYSIDEDNIILGGFSMGGYGVYYTFYTYPEKFKALAVFSGNPIYSKVLIQIFSKIIRPTLSPSFLKEKYLESFKNIPIFIFHGKEDRNCPYEFTAEFVKKLKAAGIEVEFCTDEGLGHSWPNAENIKKFNKWLEEIIKTKK